MGAERLDPAEITLEAARAIRPYLRSLVAGDAPAIDASLAEVLDRPGAKDAYLEILDVLDKRPETHEWVSGFFRAGGVPPEVVRAVAPGRDNEEVERNVRIALLGGGAPAGDVVLTIPGMRYTCPNGDPYVWYRIDAADKILRCPICNSELTPSPLRMRGE